MTRILEHYWLIGVLFSVAFTAWSVVWTVRANRRFARIESELHLQHKAWLAMVTRCEQLEGYLEKTPTGHMKKAPLLTVLYGGRDSVSSIPSGDSLAPVSAEPGES